MPQLKFVKEKETKNKIRYKEVEQPGQPTLIDVIYVAKWWALDVPAFTLTIEAQ